MVQDDHSLRRLTVALTAAVLLGGCATPRALKPSASPASAQSPPQPLPYQSSPSQQPPARENHLSAATGALVAQANTQIARGDLAAASSTLDRALRIEPNNPLLWIELGRLRLAENDAHQAEICAHKALALASGDRRAQSQAGRLLVDALRIQGRNQEAGELEKQPFMN
jgi:tetratricopeptide (TPR) repeat protein